MKSFKKNLSKMLNSTQNMLWSRHGSPTAQIHFGSAHNSLRKASISQDAMFIIQWGKKCELVQLIKSIFSFCFHEHGLSMIEKFSGI